MFFQKKQKKELSISIRYEGKTNINDVLLDHDNDDKKPENETPFEKYCRLLSHAC